MYMVAVTTVCCYTQESVLCQTTHSASMLIITVEPILVVDNLLCPKFIVFDLCSHINIL